MIAQDQHVLYAKIGREIAERYRLNGGRARLTILRRVHLHCHSQRAFLHLARCERARTNCKPRHR
jgi:hypothetical protein